MTVSQWSSLETNALSNFDESASKAALDFEQNNDLKEDADLQLLAMVMRWTVYKFTSNELK